MPRPKVRLEDRQRAVKACLPCKSSKKRCDAQQPCSNCVRRRATAHCHYVDPTEVKHHRKSSQPQPVDFGTVSNESTFWSQYPSIPRREPLEEVRQSFSKRLKGQPVAEDRKCIGGRLLLNEKGERVYVGEFASLSFLQFLRHTIRQQMGPSLFTENPRRKIMLEVASTKDTNTKFVEDDHQKAALLDVYFAATNGILDLFSKDEVDASLEVACSQNGASYTSHNAALDLMVAIGAQCRAEGPLDRQYATTLFSRARTAIMAEGLEDPSVDMVRCFLLMSFYMLGACRRNATFIYLGIASQAASAVGLHVTEQYRHFEVADRMVRLRTLRGLRILDVIYCSILGRPYSTTATRTHRTTTSLLQIPAATHRDLAVKASFEVCSIIAEITPQLDAVGSINLSTAEGFLKQLHDWSATLPAEMRHFSRSADEPLTLEEQERTIGNIHVSCAYYYAVMLVARPFLITHLMAQLSSDTPPTTKVGPPATTEVTDLGQACIDSAMLMANMCYEALRSSVLLKQMCLLKAWIFAAGLVLGFSMFAKSESRIDMDDSFSNAREVLHSLSAESAQAEHYYEILTGFADVIQRRRQHLSRGSRPPRNKYVDQILTFDVTPSPSRSQSTLSTESPATKLDGSTQEAPTTTNGVGDFDFQMPDLSQWPLENGGGFDFGMFGWDNFAMQISENFTFDYDPSWGNT